MKTEPFLHSKRKARTHETLQFSSHEQKRKKLFPSLTTTICDFYKEIGF